MSEIIKSIDKTVCLLLDKRMNYWTELYEQCQMVNIQPERFVVGDGSISNLKYDYIDEQELPPKLSNSTYYPTWWARPNAYNAWKSHRQIFEQAYNDGVKQLLLLEDDAQIENDFLEVIRKAEEYLNTVQYDIIYFGSYRQRGSYNFAKNSNVLKVLNCGGFHAVLLTRPIIKELLNFQPIGPYDYICGNYINPTVNAYAIFPCVITQRNNIFSYVEMTNLPKPSRYHEG